MTIAFIEVIISEHGCEAVVSYTDRSGSILILFSCATWCGGVLFDYVSLVGEPFDGVSLVGEPFDGVSLVGVPFDGVSLVGEPFDGVPSVVVPFASVPLVPY